MMKEFFAALANDETIKEFIERFQKRRERIYLHGVGASQKYALMAAATSEFAESVVIIVSERQILQEWQENLSQLLPNVPVLELPALDDADFTAVSKGAEIASRRMDALGRLARGERVIVLALSSTAVQRGVSKTDFVRMSLKLKLGDKLEREAFLAKLVGLGYSSAFEVECMGQFSVRGGIVDVFPINSKLPVRVEFFDDEIDSLREYELETKRSLHNIGEFSVLPLTLTDEEGGGELFLSYLGEGGAVVLDEPARIRESVVKLHKENPDGKAKLFSWDELIAEVEKHSAVYLGMMLQRLSGAKPDVLMSIVTKAATPYQRQLSLFIADVEEYVRLKNSVLIFMSNAEKGEALREMLVRKSIAASFSEKLKKLEAGKVTISTGGVENGFEIPSAKLVVITEKDIFGRRKKKTYQRTEPKERIHNFREINVGDYVVHVNHGIGKYQGVETIEVDGIHRDYLFIRYGGDDKLYVPTEQVRLLHKYIGAEGEVPRLSRLNSVTWEKTKAKAKSAAEDIAKDLLALYAKRSKLPGFSFLPDTPWQKEFEDDFPYEETPDQAVAIEQIKADMERGEPMERLLCGDVGFGKTEVAMRAAFKAVMSGKQVAVLVPTTVLAQQHYRTFLARFFNFGPSVDVICRFRTAKEQRQTIEGVESGKVDILIGTHAILNQKRIKFKDLGLLIIDEEQRFGVKQKEKIKSLAEGVDVLTLSATPIPRTLHMSLVGARDISIIETPPAERYPIQTYVIEDDDAILAAAIRRELKRGGQLYFIHNRIETIDLMQKRIEELVPEARTQVVHGRLPEELIERAMLSFYEGEFDILISTSIVENGLDVANANTIIVYNADYFGLSQLYQMRGRVGRSSRLAFAYFVYQRDKVLSETAQKRLQTMKDFAELGAGFKIAMRDLEIRGAGNLLGAEQHGHIAGVGFEMYCRLLEETVTKLKTGEEPKEIPEPLIVFPVEAYLDNGYITDAMHKIEFYQRIAAVRKEKQRENLLDEIVDRFGEPTKPVLNLFEIVKLKNYARDLGIKSLVVRPGIFEITFVEKPSFNPDNLVALVNDFGGAIKFLPELSLLRIKLKHEEERKILSFAQSVLAKLSGKEEEKK